MESNNSVSNNGLYAGLIGVGGTALMMGTMMHMNQDDGTGNFKESDYFKNMGNGPTSGPSDMGGTTSSGPTHQATSSSGAGNSGNKSNGPTYEERVSSSEKLKPKPNFVHKQADGSQIISKSAPDASDLARKIIQKL